MLDNMQAILRIECKDPETIKKSLLPDVEEKKDLKIDLSTDEKDLIIKIESKKISYLKAVINSYLSLVKPLKEMEEREW
jgi:tRNA threonylcarbamoyladenosine modification (KEOPS) complex  Pcc1 subunit